MRKLFYLVLFNTYKKQHQQQKSVCTLTRLLLYVPSHSFTRCLHPSHLSSVFVFCCFSRLPSTTPQKKQQKTT
eukprot:gene2211-1377_t